MKYFLLLGLFSCASIRKDLAGPKLSHYGVFINGEFIYYEKTSAGSISVYKEFKASEYNGWHLIPGEDFEKAF